MFKKNTWKSKKPMDEKYKKKNWDAEKARVKEEIYIRAATHFEFVAYPGNTNFCLNNHRNN